LLYAAKISSWGYPEKMPELGAVMNGCAIVAAQKRHPPCGLLDIIIAQLRTITPSVAHP
jgi:hypothetical protein